MPRVQLGWQVRASLSGAIHRQELHFIREYILCYLLILKKTDRFKKWSTRMCADHVKNFDQKGIWLKILEFPIISSSSVCFQYEDVRGTADIITDSSSSPQGWMLTQFCF